jgi:hypothetical protein
MCGCSRSDPTAPSGNYGLPANGKGDDPKVKVPNRLIDGNAAPPCVMYHTRSSVHDQSKFCATCSDTIKGSTARSGASSRAGPVGGGYPQLLLGVHVPSVQAQFGNGHVYPHAPQLPLTVPLVSQPVVDPQSSQPGRQA